MQITAIATDELKSWYLMMHDRGHFLHINSGPGMYGSDYMYQTYDGSGGKIELQYWALQVAMHNVSYKKDEFTKCEDQKREESLRFLLRLTTHYNQNSL